jgi:hypothetical protein
MRQFALPAQVGPYSSVPVRPFPEPSAAIVPLPSSNDQ